MITDNSKVFKKDYRGLKSIIADLNIEDFRLLQMVNKVTEAYKELHRITEGLWRIGEDWRGLHRITEECKCFYMITEDYRGLQRITEDYICLAVAKPTLELPRSNSE